MNLEFSDYVECDLQAIAHWFAKRNPAAGERLLNGFRDECRLLVQFPSAGFLREEFKPNRVRSWPIGGFENYLILYRVHVDAVEVWRVVHGARDFRKLAGEES